ncbi:Poly(A) polymerase [Tetrabaena socialis]|uniref:Poly(A) polymerase n=1 Tax=Tetrabaena socialis TaxID=47790 RepID=A0A2J8A4E9_9CHLO|nr:Poly(A) polymerase [Tetrabaena socialis]|eukprot:PNH07401.1 Poly(A) polymerase [Tetrabaena socialis]
MAGADDIYLLRPLNEHAPTAEDKRHSAELEEVLRANDLYESLDDALLREDVLGLFYQLVQTWVKGVCRKKGFNAEDARAHVYTFGSYRLGVHGPGESAARHGVCSQFLRCTGGKPIDWALLFTPVPFFTQHTFYIQASRASRRERTKGEVFL